jgi:hypothetical protein
VHEFRVACGSVAKNLKPIDRIIAILNVQEEPPPPAPAQPALKSPNNSKKRPKPRTSAEDNRLLYAIHRYGLQQWPVTAAFVGNGRTRAQCAQRWSRGLDPRIHKGEWSLEEDQKLLSLVAFHGGQGWTYVSREMGNRSDVQCRYHYLQLSKLTREANQVIPFRPLTPMGPMQFLPMSQPVCSEPQRKATSGLLKKKKGRPLKNVFTMCPLFSNGHVTQVPDNPQPPFQGEMRPVTVDPPMVNERTEPSRIPAETEPKKESGGSPIDWSKEYQDSFIGWD